MLRTILVKGGALKQVCLVIGAGAGIGGHVAKRFAREGYHAVMCRRSNKEGLQKIIEEIEMAGGSAEGCIINAVEPNAIENFVASIEADVGPVQVALFNLGAQIGTRALSQTSYKQFELGWRLATFALFRFSHCLTPYMEERGCGTILVTSSTAAIRGNAGQHSHAAAMGGRRMLCQALNAELGPKGIHVAHILVDGAVDAPDTLGKMLGAAKFEELREKRGRENDGLIQPEKVADTYWHIAQQHRSTWTFEADIRSFDDSPWWND